MSLVHQRYRSWGIQAGQRQQAGGAGGIIAGAVINIIAIVNRLHPQVIPMGAVDDMFIRVTTAGQARHHVMAGGMADGVVQGD